MGIFRRRRRAVDDAQQPDAQKEAALLDAQRAVARLRRSAEDVERYRAGKQDQPVTRMTQNQWLAGGS